MHRDSPGYEKIERGKYVVSDEDSGGALIRQDKWLDSFRPGKRIGLSFLLKHPGARDNRECPRCKTLKTTPGYHEGQRRWYSNSLTVQKKNPGADNRSCSTKCHLTYKIEDREQTKLYWKNLKMGPKPPPSQSSQPKPQMTKPKATPITRPLIRSHTLKPSEFDHQYCRVHYERNITRRTAVEPGSQRWLVVSFFVVLVVTVPLLLFLPAAATAPTQIIIVTPTPIP